MKHLSITTKQLPREIVLKFVCRYKQGDHFVTELSEVNCKSCLQQIKSAT